jgi:hypothetical protein
MSGKWPTDKDFSFLFPLKTRGDFTPGLNEGLKVFSSRILLPNFYADNA